MILMIITVNSITVRADKVIGTEINLYTLKVYLEGIPTPLEHTYSNRAEVSKAQQNFIEKWKMGLDKSPKV